MSTSEFEDPLPTRPLSRVEQFHLERGDDKSPLGDIVSEDPHDPFVWRDRRLEVYDKTYNKYAHLGEKAKQYMWQLYRSTGPDVAPKIRDEAFVPEDEVGKMSQNEQEIIQEYRESLLLSAEKRVERHRATLKAIIDFLNAKGDIQQAEQVMATFSAPTHVVAEDALV